MTEDKKKNKDKLKQDLDAKQQEELRKLIQASRISKAPPPIEPVGGLSYFSPPKTKPDYDHWNKSDGWTLQEAAYLLCDQCPEHRYHMPSDVKRKIQKVSQRLERTVKIRRLVPIAWGLNPSLYNPIDIIKWAEDNNISIPPEITVAANKEKSTEQAPMIFPCKTGTKWEDVEITLISRDTVMIKTPEISGRYHFSKLNMEDGRSGDTPTKSWKLLMYFCKYSGRITSETTIYDIQNPSKAISDLNKTLQGIFEIHEDFCKTYNKNDGWVARCIFNDKTEST